MSKPPKTGRPTKFNQAIQEQICLDIRRGLGKGEAALRAGITRETLRVWIETKLAFSDALEKAWADFEANQLLIVQEAAITHYNNEGNLVRRGNWYAAAWLLERRMRDKYALPWRAEVVGAGGKPLIPDKPAVDLSRYTPNQLDVLIKALSVPAVEEPGPANGNGNGGV